MPIIPEPKYKVGLLKSRMVPMRDDTRLSTDLYVPETKKNKLPVILIRTPYNKNNYRDKDKRPMAYMFASQGYCLLYTSDAADE